MRHWMTAAVAATALIAAAAGDVWAQAGTIRVRLNSDIRSTDPGTNRDENTDAVVQHMIEGLVAFKEDATVGPMLAEKIAVSEDATTYTFTLRDGVTFHNGAKLTADDVVWAWKRYADPATKWRCAPDFDGRGLMKVTGVEAKDPRTVVFALAKPSALFLTVMARVDCGSTGIYHRDSVGPDGKWVQPIGTGPFKLGEWKRGEYVELLRNTAYAARPGRRDGYTGNKTPLVDRLRFVVIPDAAAAKAALLSGSVDLLPDTNNADAAELRKRPEVAVHETQTMSMSGILFQTKDPQVGDVRLRKAILAALDTTEIVKAVTEGEARPNASPIPTASPFHTAAHQAVPKQDLALAKKLLAEAGYKGQAIKIVATKRYPTSFDTAVLAQAMMQAAGINAEIEVLDWATMLDKYSKGDYQMMSFLYSARLDPALSFEMITGPKATQPRKVWDNPEAIAMIQDALAVGDRAKRQAIFDQLYARFQADRPMIVLYNGMETGVTRKQVKGYASFVIGVPRLWGVSIE
ncbi:MAG: ABC transporter substrate-binding protein [Alphaproteobacteria bacterium]|nr:ABC transporter substrate-binding protein [Alphaproteobacteria bacterium]